MPTTIEDKLQVNSHDVAWREIGDELVVLHMATARYLTINGSGALLWHRLIDGATRSQLVETLVDRFGLASTQADSDVAVFVEALDKCKLLV